MNIKDYLLDHDGWPWSQLLKNWTWLIPETFTVWIANRFGDLFLCMEDGSIHHLDIGGGTLNQVAESRDAFCDQIDDAEKANYYLMIPLVDKLVAAGRTLHEGECYSFQTAPAFREGAYILENIVVRSIADHYNIFGPLHELTKDIPDGTRVRFTTS